MQTVWLTIQQMAQSTYKLNNTLIPWTVFFKLIEKQKHNV